jgi:hypothetical protein
VLVRDYVHKEWEHRRFLRLKGGMVHAEIPSVVESQLSDSSSLSSLLNLRDVRTYLSRMSAGDLAAEEELKTLLQEAGLTLEGVKAAAFAKTILPQIHTDRMDTAACEQRNLAYEHLRAEQASSRGTQATRNAEDEPHLPEEAPAMAPRDAHPPSASDELDAKDSPSLRHDVGGQD